MRPRGLSRAAKPVWDPSGDVSSLSGYMRTTLVVNEHASTASVTSSPIGHPRQRRQPHSDSSLWSSAAAPLAYKACRNALSTAFQSAFILNTMSHSHSHSHAHDSESHGQSQGHSHGGDFARANAEYFNVEAVNYDKPAAVDLHMKQLLPIWLKAYDFDPKATAVLDYACGTGMSFLL
jgi:hypothetical protein